MGDEIYISISTSLVGSAPEGGCISSPLLGIADGEYRVFYQNVDESKFKLGKVVVGT